MIYKLYKLSKNFVRKLIPKPLTNQLILMKQKLNLTKYSQKENQKRVPGRLKGQIQIADDFNELDEETISLFYGEE